MGCPVGAMFVCLREQRLGSAFIMRQAVFHPLLVWEWIVKCTALMGRAIGTMAAPIFLQLI
ncbi:hypothetical protein BH10PAT4_BH10PAT4_5450 [soil metagenome]